MNESLEICSLVFHFSKKQRLRKKLLWPMDFTKSYSKSSIYISMNNRTEVSSVLLVLLVLGRKYFVLCLELRSRSENVHKNIVRAL